MQTKGWVGAEAPISINKGMRYIELLESASFELSIRNLRLSGKSIKMAFADILRGKLSVTKGPIIVSGTEYNQYQVMDGYHRVLQTILNGQRHIRCKKDIRYTMYYAVAKDEDVWVFDPKSPTLGLESLGILPAQIEQAKTLVQSFLNSICRFA